MRRPQDTQNMAHQICMRMAKRVWEARLDARALEQSITTIDRRFLALLGLCRHSHHCRVQLGALATIAALPRRRLTRGISQLPVLTHAVVTVLDRGGQLGAVLALEPALGLSLLNPVDVRLCRSARVATSARGGARRACRRACLRAAASCDSLSSPLRLLSAPRNSRAYTPQTWWK